MSISVCCPNCGTEAQVPDGSAGNRGKCRACGTVVQVPGKQQKICCACGMDVSGQPRTKDGHGRYYCNVCWAEHQAAASTASHLDPESDELLACPQCGGVFGIQEMDTSGVCRRCAPTAAMPPTNATIAKTSKSSIWSSDTRLIIAILVPVLLIGGAVAGWVLWSGHAGREVRDQIATLKDVGDKRLAAGDAEAASKQYAELLEYVAANKIKDDATGTLAEVRHRKEAADAKVEQQAAARVRDQQRRESEASSKFITDIRPFLTTCREFRSAMNANLQTGAVMVSADDIKQAMQSEQAMVQSLRQLVERAKSVQTAYDTIPADLEHVRTICNVVRATAADLMQSYDNNSSSIGDMSRVRLAALTGLRPDVDATATQRRFSTLVADAATAAKLTMETVAIIGKNTGSDVSQPADSQLKALLLSFARLRLSGDASLTEAQLKLASAKSLREAGRTQEAQTTLADAKEADNAAKASATQQLELVKQIESHPRADIYAARDALVADATTPQELRPILKRITIPDAEVSTNQWENRAQTDPLIVIQHNAAVAERQYSGFFGDNNPRDVYMRGDLRLARSYFGKQDVFCLHPWSPQQPCTADFSAITLKTAGVLVFNVHNLFDPKTGTAGHCKATFAVDGTDMRTLVVEGNVWHEVQIPFDHKHVQVQVSAIGWFWEHAFFTYSLQPIGQVSEQATAADVKRQALRRQFASASAAVNAFLDRRAEMCKSVDSISPDSDKGSLLICNQ